MKVLGYLQPYPEDKEALGQAVLPEWLMLKAANDCWCYTLFLNQI